MQLKEAQQVLAQVSNRPASALDALRQLQACTNRAVGYLEDGNTMQAQVLVEQGLTNLMVAFHYLNLDLEKVVQREKQRHAGDKAKEGQDRVILIFSDHAELRVDGELRGTIPLYGLEDYQELRQIGHLFDCRLEHADHMQLNLFALMQQRLTAGAHEQPAE